MSTRVFRVDGDDAFLERCARALEAEGAAISSVGANASVRTLDGYSHILEVILTVVRAQQDVRSLYVLADQLKPRMSVATVRGWFYAARLRPGDVLALARLIRAFCVSRERGVRLAGALARSDRRTVERFFERAGLKDGQVMAAPQTLEELLARQRFVQDPDLLAEVRAAVLRLA
jgi:hypothetical protein